MNINNPNELPTLQGQLIVVQDRITLGNAEVERLHNLATSELYTVGQLSTQKKELEEQVGGLQDIVRKIESDIANLRDVENSITASNDKGRVELVEKKDTLDKLALELDAMGKALKVKDEELMASKAQHEKDKAAVEADRKDLSDKLAQIRAINL